MAACIPGNIDLCNIFQKQLKCEYDDEDEAEDALGLDREWVLKEIFKAKFENFFQA
ncbi:hypothetical protein HBI14_191540 [Parastagonospora nodorum]|nr:hypothetical protein HBI14_191540 [Parastagonospora nodorum]